VEHLLQAYPGHTVVLTTTTPTGSERVRALFGERVFHVYSPWDLPGAVSRFFRRVRPRLLVIMETELWPNLLHVARRESCPVVLANARLSARSARGYRRFAGLTRQMLQQLTVVACQSRDDGQRFVALGLPPDRLRVTGSIKFDLDIDDALRGEAAALREAWQRPVILGSSTHPGEESLLLDCLGSLRDDWPQLLLLLVPRHPERFGDVYRLCVERNLSVARRSLGEAPGPGHQVLLGDTMGELRLLSGTATVAVIGGSFIEHGGQNVLEAAAWGVPVVSGPHMYNFTEITGLLTAAGALRQLDGGAALLPCLRELLGDAELRRRMGQAGERVVAGNRGALQRLQSIIAGVIAGA
jgi:3-deoxy-D-manno-octulosonic-acid transferase